jgi:hypothetical protein
VDSLIEAIRGQLCGFAFDDAALDIPYAEDWKDHASEAIKGCVGVVCVVGETSHDSEPVNWEIQEAVRLQKPVIVVSAPGLKLPAACKRLKGVPIPPSHSVVASRISDLLLPCALFGRRGPSNESESATLLWNQYNLMVQSWEALISRRQTINNIYLTANATLLAGVGVFLGNADKVGESAAAAAAIVLAVVGGALGLNWLQTISSYGALSRAKAKLVLAFEPYLPAKLFEIEWAVLESLNYKSTTKMELHTARWFVLLFVLLLALALAMAFGWIAIPPSDGRGSPH